MCTTLKKSLLEALRLVSDLSTKELLDTRYERLQSYGRFGET
jgi:acetyl-CoA carboxylase carboxyl transferase subunit alpha